MDISVVIPVVNECDNLRILLPRIQAELEREHRVTEMGAVGNRKRRQDEEVVWGEAAQTWQSRGWQRAPTLFCLSEFKQRRES